MNQWCDLGALQDLESLIKTVLDTQHFFCFSSSFFSSSCFPVLCQTYAICLIYQGEPTLSCILLANCFREMFCITGKLTRSRASILKFIVLFKKLTLCPLVVVFIMKCNFLVTQSYTCQPYLVYMEGLPLRCKFLIFMLYRFLFLFIMMVIILSKEVPSMDLKGFF